MVRARPAPRRADLQKFLAAGARVTPALERATAAPANYGIASLPQPSSAPQMLYQSLQAQLQSARPRARGRRRLDRARCAGLELAFCMSSSHPANFRVDGLKLVFCSMRARARTAEDLGGRERHGGAAASHRA
jgi:hypothetical protein